MGTVYYNRGVGAAAMWIEALKNAQKIHNKVGKTVNGDEFRDGYEALDITDAKLKEIGILGMSAPFKMSCAKHDGSERFKVMQWDGKKFQLLTDWVPAPDPAFIRELIEEPREVRGQEQHHAARVLPDRRSALQAQLTPCPRMA